MRERLRLSDLNLLTICTEDHYGPLSRRALADAVNFRNTGGNVWLVCHEGSQLAKQAERQDIRTYLLSTPLDWAGQWKLFQLVRQLIKQQELDIVHTYNFRPLLSLGAALKRETRIPLIYTSNEDITQAYLPFWHDYSVTRLDHILTFSGALAERASEVLPLGGRKFTTLGAGIEPITTPHVSPRRPGFRVASYVPTDEADLNRLLPLLQTVGPLFYALQKPLILELLTEGSWYEHPLYPSLKHAVLERGLEHQVAFGSVPWSKGGVDGKDLFIALPGGDIFDDLELEALFHGVPVLLPRTSARTQVLQGGGFGLTYLPGDMREVKTKALEILRNHDKYLRALQENGPTLLEKHQAEPYVAELFQVYEKLVLQRLRFSLKRHAPFANKT